MKFFQPQMCTLKEATYLDEFDHVVRRVHHKAASNNVSQPVEILGIRTVRLWYCGEKQPPPAIAKMNVKKSY